MKRIAQVSQAEAVPAPVGGWNALDGLGDMPATDAPVMINMDPGTTSVKLRKGRTSYATGIPATTQTLAVFNGQNASTKLFAFAGTDAYDASAAGAVGAAVLSGLTNAQWQYINVSTTAGNYLMALNGADKARYYTGSVWAKDGDGAPYDITGANSANCIHINLHKFRVWLIQKDSLTAWYSATGAIGGAYTAFNLTGVARRGGYLMAMATWTLDAGYGVDDHAVFITSKGDVIVYRGTDPSSASTWGLVGVWELGAPVGRRCFAKFGGDLLLICQDGVLPLAGALQSSRLNPRVAITNQIQKAMSEAVSNYGSNFGWEIIHSPKENRLLLNVPVSSTAQEQYVMNTITKKWTRYKNWGANCWALFSEDLYYGSATTVEHAYNGLSDGSGDIQAFTLGAFNYFKDRAYNKRFVMMKPSFLTNGEPSTYGTINTNFNLSQPTAPLSFSATTYGVWDTAVWDTAVWGDDMSPQENWQGVTAEGICGAPSLMISAQGIEVEWLSTTVMWERSKGVLLS